MSVSSGPYLTLIEGDNMKLREDNGQSIAPSCFGLNLKYGKLPKAI